MPNILIALVALSVGFFPTGRASAMDDAFKIELTGKKVMFDTKSGITHINGHAKAGLVAASTRQGHTMLRFWQAGAFRETIILKDQILVDGLNVSDTARISGFRLARDGSYVYLRSTKGPKARVQLIQNGHMVKDWPRGHHLRIISYDRQSLILSETLQEDHATAFHAFKREENGGIDPQSTLLGTIRGCVVQSARKKASHLLLQTYCSHENGSDIFSFDMETGQTATILATEKDELFGSSLLREKDRIPILQIDGNANGRRAFYAISNIFLASLGEPMSLASDEAGTQSWGQSFRLRTLGVLAEKTGHPVFPALARHSINQTLLQQNHAKGFPAEFNPSCGWASRIYSQDGMSPISLLVNQAMIASSMISACEKMGEVCPAKLKARVMDMARCLVSAYEPTFDGKSGLYRIPYGAPFRFDGIWAPWNWQLAWAPVLEKVGKADGRIDLVHRSHGIARQFMDSWQVTEAGALWRYWTSQFYTGWVADDRVSKARPEQKKHAPRRFEDTSHAGISLLGLQDLQVALPDRKKGALRKTLDYILSQGLLCPEIWTGQGREVRAGCRAVGLMPMPRMRCGLFSGGICQVPGRGINCWRWPI